MNGTRIVVVSDTHGSFHALYEIICKHQEEATAFLHLGDGWREIGDIRDAFPSLKLYSVRGNCDFSSSDPNIQQLEFGGQSILMTHGHLQGVRHSIDPLCASALNLGANILLYGHNHQGHTEYRDGLYIMCPGSPVQPRNSPASYGIVDITPAGIVLNLINV